MSGRSVKFLESLLIFLLTAPNQFVIWWAMRIKRSVTRFFWRLMLPAVSVAVVGYFGGYAIWGERGLLALEDTQAQLGIQQEQLAQLTDDARPAGTTASS